MANRILKGLAVVAGTGLAMGFTSGRSRRHAARFQSTSTSVHDLASLPGSPGTASDRAAHGLDADLLNIEPLLDRLERLEIRMEQIERRPDSPSAAVVEYKTLLADLERRLDANARDLALLREQVVQAERRANEFTASMDQRVREIREELPLIVERSVAARIDELQARLSLEMEQSHRRTLETFECAVDEKISSRIGAIEKTLLGQAESIETLALRATETDNHLQRLVNAIEKLCERTQPISPAAQQFATPLPFESQLNDAMRREPVVPIFKNSGAGTVEAKAGAAQVPAPAFTDVTEPARKKPWFLFRNLLIAGIGVAASRFLR
jgi:hypothetical protein